MCACVYVYSWFLYSPEYPRQELGHVWVYYSHLSCNYRILLYSGMQAHCKVRRTVHCEKDAALLGPTFAEVCEKEFSDRF